MLAYTIASILIAKELIETNDRYNTIGSLLEDVVTCKRYDTIVDVGCGRAPYAKMLKQNCNELIALDTNINTLQNLPPEYDNYIQMDINKNPFDTSEINADLFVMTEIVEHLYKYRAKDAILHMKGDIFVSTPSKMSNIHNWIHMNNAFKHKSLWSYQDFVNLGFNKLYAVDNYVINNIFYGEHIVAIKNNSI